MMREVVKGTSEHAKSAATLNTFLVALGKGSAGFPPTNVLPDRDGPKHHLTRNGGHATRFDSGQGIT